MQPKILSLKRYGRGVLDMRITCTPRVDIIPPRERRSSTFGHRAWASAHALCPYMGYAQYIYYFILLLAHWVFARASFRQQEQPFLHRRRYPYSGHIQPIMEQNLGILPQNLGASAAFAQQKDQLLRLKHSRVPHDEQSKANAQVLK